MPSAATSQAARTTANFYRALQSLVWLTLAFFALAASGAAWADPPGRVGRIAETSGTVWLYDDDQGDWIQAQRNRPVTEGDRLSAERGARAEVQIGSSTLRLDGGSDVEFSQLDDERVHIRLHGGSLALRVRGNEAAREFAVITGEGRYEPLRAGHYRVDARDNSSHGAALTGALRFEARDSVLDINDGQRAEFWVEGDTTHYAWAQPADDRFGDWVARENREDNRERSRYVSPEMTGADDLDRHGRWDRHPDYGAIWYPTTVTVGWAPYRHGHWAYVRPWGYTWVDDAPWGFAPFHYGRWVNWHGRWGWAPGQYVARPVYAPALVAWFGGSNVSVGIGIGGGPAVGWVPLAPREIYHPTYQVTNIYVRNVNGAHRQWHGRDPRYDGHDRNPPSRPIMYTNQGVAGGVTVVPQGVMRGRQPIGNAVVPVDVKTVSSWQTRSAPNVVPVAPPTRTAATAGQVAVPAAPGAVRAAPWQPAHGERRGGGVAGSVGAAQGDGGNNPRGGRAQAPELRPGMAVGRPPQANPTTTVPAPPRVVQAVPAQGEPQNDRRDRREVERRVAPPQAAQRPVPPAGRAVPPPMQPVPPTVQPVKPAPQGQPQPAVVGAQGQAEPSARGQRGDGPQGKQRGADRDDRDDGQQRGSSGRRGGDTREQQNR